MGSSSWPPPGSSGAANRGGTPPTRVHLPNSPRHGPGTSVAACGPGRYECRHHSRPGVVAAVNSRRYTRLSARALACVPVCDSARPIGSSRRECAFGPGQYGRWYTSDTSGPGAQRSRAATSIWFHAVSPRASPSHLPGLGPPRGPRALVTCRVTQKTLSLPGKGLDLRKLVAGAGFEPATSGL
jgi:hypothetical protein